MKKNCKITEAQLKKIVCEKNTKVRQNLIREFGSGQT